ncbi:GIY-YIG nuclease family protein [Flavobacterium ovatum]|uniref:GIY-YIG nuclease family protein n=1 Tax=Flavobacterium ovatum TaxID=1928857 RepID=UPI00344D0D80
MKDDKSEYYVYVYIDPRNFEEFYYGKGKGSRKEAHLKDDSDSEKAKRIKAIQNSGLKPIIKVIAKDLTERDAFLIEKTLLWKLGRLLSNKSSGHFAEKFRPHFTLHQNLSGFDFKNGLYYVNIGEGIHRCWDDCRQFNFLSAGQDKKYSDPIRTLEPGDIIVPYLKGHGYVGIGRVEEKAVPISQFKYDGKSLREIPLKKQSMFDNYDNEKSEYLVKVNWIKTVESNQAKKATRKDGIYSTQLIKSTLQGQPKTVEYLEKEFGIKFADLMLTD